MPVPEPLSPLFQIGLRPLSDADWFEVDDGLAAYLAEKQRLGIEHFNDVFAECDGTRDAQQEVLEVLATYLIQSRPDLYVRRHGGIDIIPTGEVVELGTSSSPPLWRAARLVQDDLLVMRRFDDGWRLVAGALCFPSSWRLRDKIGKPIHDIHAPVPGFGAGTRPAELIARIFDKTREEQKMARGNFSLYGDDALFHPEDANTGVPRFADGLQSVFLRQERQTLAKMPVSGDILFTVKIIITRLDDALSGAGGAELADALVAQLEALDADQLAYKGITLERDRLLGWIKAS